MRTEEVTQKYHITRQSINNWERFDGLKTKRTGTNRLIWDDESIGWLEQFMRNKVYDRGKNLVNQLKHFKSRIEDI